MGDLNSDHNKDGDLEASPIRLRRRRSSSARRLILHRMAGEELPFYPREKLFNKQKYFQSVSKHTYLKGPYDKITSVAIPLAPTAASLYLIGRGIYNMSHGIGKKE